MNQQAVRYQLPALLWALLIFVSSSISSDNLPPLGVLGIDKLVHFGVFFILCFFTHRAFRFQSRSAFVLTYSLSLSVVATILYGVSDEIHQIFTPGRDSTVYDALADALGGLLYAGLYRLFLIRSKTP